MNDAKKLTVEQKRRIYCVKHGHAKFVTTCFGYVSCGRCGSQVGDQLGGVWTEAETSLVVGHNCDRCRKIRRTLSKSDLKILIALEKERKATNE